MNPEQLLEDVNQEFDDAMGPNEGEEATYIIVALIPLHIRNPVLC